MCVLERGTKEKKKRVLSFRKGIESKGSCYGYAGIFYRISTYYQKVIKFFPSQTNITWKLFRASQISQLAKKNSGRNVLFWKKKGVSIRAETTLSFSLFLKNKRKERISNRDRNVFDGGMFGVRHTYPLLYTNKRETSFIFKSKQLIVI